MTAVTTPPRHGDDPVTDYEALRSRALAGSPGGGHAGLVVLLRQGVAAWLSRRQPIPRPVPAGPGASAPPLPAEEVHADLVRLLAGMALAGL